MSPGTAVAAERAGTDPAGPRARRVAFVHTYPVQYFAPLYAYLAAAEDLDVTVLYCSDWTLRPGRRTGFGRSFVWDVDLLKGYRAVFLGPRARTRVPGGFWSLIVPEVVPAIRSGRYDAVILHGHRYAVNLLAFLAAKASGTPVFLRGDTHLGLRRSRWARWFRRTVVGAMYRWSDRLLAVGTANARFYMDIGVDPERIELVPYAVDNGRFAAASRLTASERAAERAALGIAPDATVVLFASKFQRRKRPHDLVRAAAMLSARGLEITLLLVGDGEMRAELERLVAELGLTHVVFAGFVNQSRLPRTYAISDLFVLPSEDEPWGLVVDEVMCAGLPVVTSREAGCAADLVVDGENGFLFDAGDVGGLARALERLLSDAELRARMGERSRARIEQWSFRECLQGLRRALGEA